MFWPGPLFSAWVGEGTGDERYPGHTQCKKPRVFKQLALYLNITYADYLRMYSLTIYQEVPPRGL